MRFRTCLLGLLVVGPWAGSAQSADIAKIVQEGKTHNQAAKTLYTLCKQFGARRTGSRALEAAQLWAMEQMKAYGLSNVHREKWGAVPIGFERGKGYQAQVVEPYRKTIEFSSAAWSPGTNGPLRAEAVEQPVDLDELARVKSSLKGKWVLMHRAAAMRGARRSDPLTEEQRKADPAAAKLEDVDRQLDALGIAGRVYGEENVRDLVHTHGTWKFIENGQPSHDVRVNISASEMRRIRRAMSIGRKVMLEFNVDQRFVPGEVPVYNLIGEIPGADPGGEVVIVGGHLDSWDGPRSEGASDNGTGSSTVLEAARILAATGAKPKRTIRFILFTGEEQGLLGSVEYVKQHESELDKIVAVLVEDGGSNLEIGLYGQKSWLPILEAAVKPTNDAFPDAPLKIQLDEGKPEEAGGTDYAPFLWHGVPAFEWDKKREPQDYFFIWHTGNDTYENAVPANLTQMSTNNALTAFMLASMPERMNRISVKRD